MKLKYDNLGAKTKEKISTPLSKLSLLQRFLKKSMDPLLNSKGDFNKEIITEDFYRKDFYETNFSKFMNYFDEWLNEMDDNDISFAPFHNNQDHDKIMDFIIGRAPSSSVFSNKAKGDIIIKEINKLAHSGEFKNETDQSKFLKIFDKVLEEQVNKILN